MSRVSYDHGIRDLIYADIPYMLPLNNAHAAETSHLDELSMAELIGMASYVRGVDRGAMALLIALDQDAPYINPNFAWFKARYESFVYVDRVIVAKVARGKGLAKALYEDLFEAAEVAGQTRVVCEINSVPPNSASDAFHGAMGFIAVGEAVLYNGSKTVRYFERVLA